jgi:hypothetical protein
VIRLTTLRRFGRARRPAQAIPILALTLLLLLAFSGLAIDGALAFAWRRNVSNAADGAAMMGTRALVDIRVNGGTGADITALVRDYLSEQFDEANPSFEIYYVDASTNRLPRNNPQPIGSGSPPITAVGVSVDTRYTFDTYLMRLMGQETLTVGGSGTAKAGQLGSAVGPEVVPLGVDQTAADIIRDMRDEDVVIDLFGEMEAENEARAERRLLGLPTPDDLEYDISADMVRSVNLVQGDTDPPTLGGGTNCNGRADNNTLKFWWCQGSNDILRASMPGVDDPQGTSDLDPALHGMIESRTRANSRIQTVLVPVLEPVRNDDGDWEYYVNYFMAFELVDYNGNDTPGSYRELEVRYVANYVAPGGIVGFTSGEVRGDQSWWMCDACAINLVKDVP